MHSDPSLCRASSLNSLSCHSGSSVPQDTLLHRLRFIFCLLVFVQAGAPGEGLLTSSLIPLLLPTPPFVTVSHHGNSLSLL